MSIHNISTPRGQVIHVATKGGKVTAKLEWDRSFGPRYTKQFNAKQKFVDNEVLKHDAKYIPLRTGMLMHSGTLGTVVGSGLVQYIAPYSHHQYYNTAQTRWYDANRGAKWFERMKAIHKEDILRGAGKIKS